MQVGKYLQNHQPIIYKTFTNALKNNHLSHAYLLVGNPGTPLYEVAHYLAKSILCDEPNPLACNTCITCLRVDDNNYPDFIFFDGSKGTIKKEAVNQIETQFEKKAFESKGIMIYILHLVENMTVEAVNSILKFLEEPQSQIYAFLTTNNENNVLPTIVSRCQILYLKQIDRKEIIKDSIQLGVNEQDAELLSYFYNDAELIFEFVNNKDESGFYFKAKGLITDLFDTLINTTRKQSIFYFQSKIIPEIKTKETLRFFLDLLVQFFEDMLSIKYQKEIILKSYDTILTPLLTKLPHIEDSLVEILKQRNLINTNVNMSLLLDHLIFYIVKE